MEQADRIQSGLFRRLLNRADKGLLGIVAVVVSAAGAWLVMTRFGPMALAFAVVGMVGLAVLTYVSNKDLSFALMAWLISMGGFRTIGMVSMPGLPDFSFDRLLLVWIIMMFGTRLVIERMRLHRPYWGDFFILGHTVYVLVQLHMKGSLHMHEWTISSLSPFFGFLYGKYIIRKPQEIRNLLIFLACLCFYFAFTSVAERFGLDGLVYPKSILDPNVGALWQPGRSRGPVMHPPLFGQLQGMMLFIYLFFIIKSRGTVLRSLSIFGTGMAAIGLFFAYTRGPWIATVAALGMVFTLHRNYRRVLGAFAIVGVLIGFLGMYQALNSDFLQERVQKTLTIENRLIFLNAAVNMVKDYPIFGLGFFRYNDYRNLYHEGAYIPFYGYVQKSRGHNMVIHDIYLGRLAEEGLVGVLLLLGFSISIFRAWIHKWRSWVEDPWFDRNTLTLFAGMMVCYHVGGMVIDYRYFDLINVIHFLISGIVYGYRNADYGFGETRPAPLAHAGGPR